MTPFSSTGGREHVARYGGLQDGGAYSAYVRCDDGAGNVNDTDYEVGFTVGFLPSASPAGSPRIVHSQPRGDLASGTSETVLHVATDENAVCAWSNQSGTSYGQMTPFEQTNTTGHATPIVGLQTGQSYQLYVRCADSGGTTNNSDYTIAFSVGLSTPAPASPAQVSSVSASSGRSYQADQGGLAATDLFPQQSNVHQYTDRNREFRTIPPSFVGVTYIRTANDDKNMSPSASNFLSFDVGEEVAVFVAHDDRVSPRPDWLDGFVDTGLDIYNEKDDTGGFSVLLAIFPAGRVTLGSNVAQDMGPPVSMYTVIVAPAGQLPSLLP
jgi:hypothetical protein